MLIDLVMPRMGESIMECTVIQWLKKPGDRIGMDESVMEVATDKVDTEVLAPQAGVLAETLVHDGDVVAVGAVIGRLETDVTVPLAAPAAGPPAAPEAENGQAVNGQVAPGSVAVAAPPADVAVFAPETFVPLPALTETETESAEVARQLETQLDSLSGKAVAGSPGSLVSEPGFAGRFYSPLVLTIAREEGIGRAELDRIPGSGAEQRVTKTDILAYLKTRTPPAQLLPDPTDKPAAPMAVSEPPVADAAPVTRQPPPPARSLNGHTDIIQMDRMRKLIAQRMVESVQVAPHVSSFVEADMTAVVQWRTRFKDEFKRQTGENLTYTPMLIEAVVRAIKDFPLINVSVEGDTILVKKQINIGMAVALPSGNLIVPVIHQADQYNLVGLTKRVNDLSQRARDNKLTADDLAHGTYTVSNIGTFGNVMGTPIIVQPQVAIMAFGAIQKKPAVIETPLGDTLGIRQLMFLSHSYDHRVVDGSLGGRFVRRVADYLEQFDPNRAI
jgi:2-oxoglutarate dehydrogenase E2 component (dihydrolipoamide succinyltransferase)